MQIHPDLLFIDTDLTMPMGIQLPVRSVVVKTSQGGVFISPGPTVIDNKENISAFTNIKFIVAPNLFHHLNIKKAFHSFPQAELWGVKGFEKKREDIKWTHYFDIDNWPLQEELMAIYVQGAPKVNEVVFLHKKSKSLIVSDLCFNLQKTRGLAGWIVFNLFGTYKKFAVSRFIMKFIEDRAAFKKSVEQILEWDFDKIIVSHGEVVTENAKEQFVAGLKARKLI